MRILIADDHPLVRQGLRQILASEPDMTLAGEATSGTEVLELGRTVEWDVAILDFSMPEPSGFELLSLLKREFPARPLLVLSMYPEDARATRVLKAGAAGYITKQCAPLDLVAAIRKVAAGGKYVSPALAEQLASELTSGGKPLHEKLTDREFRVMWLLASGRTIGQIAKEMSLGPSTVSTFRSRILKKLEVSTTADLVRYAVRHGLVE